VASNTVLHEQLSRELQTILEGRDLEELPDLKMLLEKSAE
jgi:predicted house-cleaning noncanonical NTP pyrophosphatase (MazG superfamily)